MSARDELRSYVRLLADMWTSPKVTERRVEHLYAAVRAEVLAEADLLPKSDVVAWLTKKARENTPVWLLASKADRGAIRPDNLRMLPADFYQPGHTYTHVDDETDWKFRVDTVTARPENGERTALGWRHFRGEWEPYAYHEDDWDAHLHVGLAVVTKDGEGS